MKKLESIEFDLSDYKITLQFHDGRDPLVAHFDTPSRRFHFSVIALTTHEMKKKAQPGFIYIRRYQDLLQRLDQGLSGKHASKNVEGMWAKIKMAWRHRLPDLEAAALFKILDRDLIPPYEKGGKYRYECSDDQCDIWTSLFGYDENNTWRFSFAGDSAVVDFNAVSLSHGQLKDNAAWKAFLDRLSIDSKIDSAPKKNLPTKQAKRAFAIVSAFVVFAAILSTWFLFQRQTAQKEGLELPDRPSIAVLPFTNLSDDPQQEYFTDGIVDGIITALSRVPKLFVIASKLHIHLQRQGGEFSAGERGLGRAVCSGRKCRQGRKHSTY